MLFKRIIEGKSVLKPVNRRRRDLTAPDEAKVERCDRRKSECVAEFCAEHSTLIEETLKMVLLGFVMWAGLLLGSLVAPYPLNLIVSADIMHPPPLYDYPFPSAENLRRLPPISSKHTNRSVSLSILTVDMQARLEDNLKASGIVAGRGTTAQGLLVNGYLTEEGMQYDKSATIVMRATENLVATRCTRYGLHNDECASFISTLELRGGELGGECAALERSYCSPAKTNSRFRTFDGACNNPLRSSWGKSLTGYKRLLHPKYNDGIDEPRRAVSGGQLPSARAVSVSLTAERDRPDDARTLALAVWAQFMHHDLAHTPVKKMVHSGESIRCCDGRGSSLAPRHRHPSCLPVHISPKDPHYARDYTTCMEYVRSATTYRGDCTFGASEQMNQATHFLDASHIYGSSPQAAAALRQSSGGLLRTDNLEDGEMLPGADRPYENCLMGANDTVCFEAGDARANLHPWLTALHVVWTREHNRLARELATLNPAWSSQRLFHEARRIVIAQIQHITYRHWLPKMTGQTFEEMFETYAGYNSDVDPTVTNAFATAAFHFVHSMLDGDVHILDKDGTIEKTLELQSHFYRPAAVREQGGLEKIVRGMISQRSQGMDLNYADDMRSGWLGGLDALAIDIQRGRDHGLPAYHQYRTLCGLPAVTTFQHYADVMPHEVVEKLSELYTHPHDVDLVVGGMAERPLPGSLLGPTFTCIIKEQLLRTRSGDRFFYSHSPGPQLHELRRSSLARVLCDNTEATALPRDVFAPASPTNPIVPCDEIKRINLNKWLDDHQSDIISRTQSNVKKWIKTRVNG